MIPGSLARRYARALILLAETPMQRESFARAIADFAAAMDCSDGSGSTLGGVLDSQRYPLSERHNVLQAVCRRLGADPTVLSFLHYVLDRGRISGIEQIARFYLEMADELAGRLHATIRSPKPLPAEAMARIKAALERSTGKTCVLDTSIEPELIGGVVTQVGSLVFDGSVKTQLHNLRNTLGGR
jgi:F-type H+-transporting ATPase subunit delta